MDASQSAPWAGYVGAGTVEFLVDRDTNAFYFIAVNPRIHVEPSVTEAAPGIESCQSPILVAPAATLPEP